MKTMTACLVVSVALLAGCAPMMTPDPVIKVSQDPYTGSQSVVLKRVQAYRCSNNQDDYRDVTLGAIAMKGKNGQVTYLLGATYLGSGWMFIERGSSFQALINGSPRMFNSAEGSLGSRETMGGSTVQEIAAWEVSRADLEDIVNTQVFQFRIVGSRMSLERCMDPQHRAAFKGFLEKTKDL